MLKKLPILFIVAIVIVLVSYFVDGLVLYVQDSTSGNLFEYINQVIYSIPNPFSYEGLPILPLVVTWIFLGFFIFALIYLISWSYVKIYNYIVIKKDFVNKGSDTKDLHWSKNTAIHFGIILAYIILFILFILVPFTYTEQVRIYFELLLYEKAILENYAVFVSMLIVSAIWFAVLAIAYLIFSALIKKDRAIKAKEEHSVSQ